VTDEQIYEEIRTPLMRYASALVGPQDAGDLVSDAVLATLRRRSLSSLDHPLAYLMRAVLNGARLRTRRAARERRAVARHGVPNATIEPSLADPDVGHALAALSVQQRSAVYLVYWEDRSPTEAARLMGLRPGTLRRYLHLARNNLRRQFDE
jgi:RNA polymerase sigma-70 factor (ECF subfamily)